MFIHYLIFCLWSALMLAVFPRVLAHPHAVLPLKKKRQPRSSRQAGAVRA